MELNTAVILSALIAIFYTWVGGLYSVAYTDVVQLGCILLGLVSSLRMWFRRKTTLLLSFSHQVICIPFAWTHEAVTPITYDSQDWMGSLTPGWEWYYADYMLLLTFGGIPWQVYFQRVLSSKSAAGAEILSYIAAFGCIIMAVPPILIGAIAKSTSTFESRVKARQPIVQFCLPNKMFVLPCSMYSMTRRTWCLPLFLNSRLERDRVHGSDPDPRRRRSHDPAHGATVPHPLLHLLLRPRRRLRRRHELRRQLGPLRIIHVRQKRLQAPLPTEGE